MTIGRRPGPFLSPCSRPSTRATPFSLGAGKRRNMATGLDGATKPLGPAPFILCTVTCGRRLSKARSVVGAGEESSAA